jgi:hypothetical protein
MDKFMRLWALQFIGLLSSKIRMFKKNELEEHVVYMEEYPNVYRVLVGKPKIVGT